MVAHLQPFVIFHEDMVAGDLLTVTIALPTRIYAEGSLAMRGGHLTCGQHESNLSMDSPPLLWYEIAVHYTVNVFDQLR